MRSHKALFSISGVFFLLILFVPVLMGQEAVKASIRHGSIYFFLVSFLLLVGALFQVMKKQGDFRKLLFPAFFSLVFTALVFISSPPSFKIFSDESNIVNTSYSLSADKKAQIAHSKIFYKDEVVSLEDYGIPARPMTTAFFTSIIHTLLGYDLENVFILNVFLFFMSFILIFFILQQWFTIRLCLILASAFLYSPIYVFSFGSGGLEAAFIFFFLFFVFSAQKLLAARNRLDWAWVLMLIASGFFFLNSRYEAVLVVIPVYAFLVNRNDKHRWPIVVAFLSSCILSAPLFWQRVYYWMIAPDVHSSYYGHFKSEIGGAFSINYLLPNLRSLWAVLQNLNFSELFPVVSIYLASALFLFAWGFFRKFRIVKKASQLSLNHAVLFGVLFQILLLLFFVSGEIHFLTQTRLFVLIWVLPFAGFCYFLIHVRESLKLVSGILFLLSAFGYYGFTQSSEYPRSNTGVQAYNFSKKFRFNSEGEDLFKENLLIASPVTQHNMEAANSVVTPKFAKENWPKLMAWKKAGVFDEIFMLKEFKLGGGREIKDLVEEMKNFEKDRNWEEVQREDLMTNYQIRIFKYAGPTL